MSVVVATLLGLLAQLAPSVGAGLAGTVINALVEIVPVVIREAQDLAPIVKNIIATLRGGNAVTSEQISQLEALDKQIDDAFETAAAAAAAEDQAAGNA